MGFRSSSFFLLPLLLAHNFSSAFEPSTKLSCLLLPPIDRASDSKNSGDGGFTISISANPEKYVPGETYDISLKELYSGAKFFTGFMLNVEAQSNGKPGSLEITDSSKVQFSTECMPTVINIDSFPKKEVSVRWRAPITGAGCVKFRALILESNGVWHAEEDNLFKELCEEEFSEPQVLESCSACSEATYKVVLEGTWSRQTHPKDFPAADAGFSEMVGASHSMNYLIWKSGLKASENFKTFLVDGNTFPMESELLDNLDYIRAIIITRGLHHPLGRSSAVIRVDQEHHLLSLVSKVIPSPDWFLGVNALELCQEDGHWMEQRIVNLYPWDAGVDHSTSYYEKNVLLNEEQFAPIRRITSSFPNDESSPFFDNSGAQLLPLARLVITKKRQYDKPCVEPSYSQETGDYEGLYDEYDTNQTFYSRQRRCAVDEWSPWTRCNATCGPSFRQRTRQFLINGPETRHCAEKTTETWPCGNLPCIDFHVGSEHCQLSPWSTWTKCSVTCGNGFKSRTRTFQGDKSRCSHPSTFETAVCSEICYKQEDAERICKQPKVVGHCHAKSERWYFNSDKKECTRFYYSGCWGNQNNFLTFDECDRVCHAFREEASPPLITFGSAPEQVTDCVISEWSEWSACSQTCGKGNYDRRRSILVFPKNGGKRCPKKLIQKRKCKLERCIR